MSIVEVPAVDLTSIRAALGSGAMPPDGSLPSALWCASEGAGACTYAGPASVASLDPAVAKEMEALAKGGVLSRSDFNERVR